MPDTKSGREKKGLNKQSQLTERLYEQELSVLDGDEEEDEPSLEDTSGEFIADELPEED
ncbi:hypothetical protein [Haloferax larsenii]|uniref:Zinc finger protein 330-like protein n=1 Tax=Haloferax larsenii TaxID=302484 RepID=A0A1H7FNI4_HALLR|nr:hypothetical protein [Haloferax larsenii]SEK27549.1 hypothetical protein SAMN04488691_10172 [Haloferax larsenii]